MADPRTIGKWVGEARAGATFLVCGFDACLRDADD
jgi:hypothetical protein